MISFTTPQNDWKDFFVSNSELLNSIENKVNLKASELQPLKVFPDNQNIFKAFELCELKNTKVVIIGQDCYHGEGQANGLCFSVNEGVKHPPSLRNIIKEMTSDLNTIIERNSDFTDLASQGVLLLNSALTVQEKIAGSHLEYWEPFTDNLIKYLSDNSNNRLVFILWGNYAKNKKKFIGDNHFIIEGTHPSPLSANRGGFFGGKYFSKANELLQECNVSEINWV